MYKRAGLPPLQRAGTSHALPALVPVIHISPVVPRNGNILPGIAAGYSLAQTRFRANNDCNPSYLSVNK